MGGRTGWWTHDISARPSDGSASSWSDILEATPDPLGKFWVTPEIATKLVPRIQSAGLRVKGQIDTRLLTALLETQQNQ